MFPNDRDHHEKTPNTHYRRRENGILNRHFVLALFMCFASLRNSH